MGKRWTEEDLKALRPGMVVTEKLQDYNTLSAAKQADSQQAEQNNCKTTIEAVGTVRNQGMNKTEARFAQHLELQKAAGELLWWAYEAMNLRLGVKCFYRIDFMVMEKSGRLVAYEVKGFWEDDALVKIRTAAEKFPWPFIAVKWKRKEKEWEYRHF